MVYYFIYGVIQIAYQEEKVMKKSKKQMKAEMKEKMSNKIKTKVTRKMKKVKLLFIVLATLAAVVAAVKAINMLIEKKRAKDPARSGLKDVLAFFATKTISMTDKITSGVMLGAYFSSLNVDLSKCEFEDGTFIAIKSGFASVLLTIPENVNVKFDSLDTLCYIKEEYDTESFIEGQPTIYIALKGSFGKVIISKAAVVEDAPEAAEA